MAKAPAAAAAPKIERVEVPALRGGEINRLEKLLDRAVKHLEKVHAAHGEASDLVSKINVLVHAAKKPPELVKAKSQSAQARARNPSYKIEYVGHVGGSVTGLRKEYDVPASDAKIGPSHRKVLNTLAWLAQLGVMEPARAQVAVLSGMTPSGGYYARIVGELKTAGLVDYPSGGALLLTPAGAAQADPGQAHQTNEEIQRDVLGRLGPSHRRVLDALIGAYPQPLPRENVAAAAQMDAGGGYFARGVGELKTMGVVTYPSKGYLRAADILFVKES